MQVAHLDGNEAKLISRNSPPSPDAPTHASGASARNRGGTQSRSRFGVSAHRSRIAFAPKTLKRWKPLTHREHASGCRSESYLFLQMPHDSGFHRSRPGWLCQVAGEGHLVCKVANPRIRMGCHWRGWKGLVCLSFSGNQKIGRVWGLQVSCCTPIQPQGKGCS